MSISLFFALLIADPAALSAATVPEQPKLTEAIVAVEAEFFQLFFEGACDAQRLRGFVTNDIEFYHDKAGFNARNANQFVAIYAKNCSAREDPKAWRTRRELIRSSLHVDPVPGWGAIQTGEHLFYERQGIAGEEKLTGKARFAQLWVLGSDGNWRLSRVLSFAHRPAQ